MEQVEKTFVFTTFSKEYLFQGRRCLRLRDRHGGLWETVPPNRLLGVVRKVRSEPELLSGPPRVGDRLCLLVGGLRVLTSPVALIEQASVASVEVRTEPDGSVSLGAVVAPALFWPAVSGPSVRTCRQA